MINKYHVQLGILKSMSAIIYVENQNFAKNHPAPKKIITIGFFSLFIKSKTQLKNNLFIQPTLILFYNNNCL